MKKEKYSTYTQIARQGGITVPKLKEILTKKKYLVLAEATKKALDSGIARKKEVKPGSDYYDPERPHYYQWSDVRVLRILARSGDKKDPRFRTFGMHNAADRMLDLGEACARHLGYEGTGDNFEFARHIEEKLPNKASEIANECAGDGHEFLIEFDYYLSSKAGFNKMVAIYERELAALREAVPGETKHIDDAEKIFKGIKDFMIRQIKAAGKRT